MKKEGKKIMFDAIFPCLTYVEAK